MTDLGCDTAAHAEGAHDASGTPGLAAPMSVDASEDSPAAASGQLLITGLSWLMLWRGPSCQPVLVHLVQLLL
jgi:hypothetical protein